jgi:hypothetical protein
MRIHHDHPIGSRRSQRVRNDPGTDRLSVLAAAILPGIPEIRQDRRYPPRAAPAARVEQQEQLNQVVTDWGPVGWIT